MTETGVAGQPPEARRPEVGSSGRDETAYQTGDADVPSRWRADTHGDTPIERSGTARRVRRGCWLLVVILLLICCVLSAWLTDSILDLRAITTSG